MRISSTARSAAVLIALAFVYVFTLSAQSAEPASSKPHAAPTPHTAGTGHIHTTAAPEIRVVSRVDNAKRTVLFGHVSSAVRKANDIGRLDPGTRSEQMVLVLKSSDKQKHELRRVLDEQQDKNTQNYHQWITPEEFGAHFGVHDADIAKVSEWLKSQGFTVDDVAKSKRVLHFSGTTGQLEKAFRTEMHLYKLNGETHVANNSDITIPKALEPVIAGVSLHNFFRKSHMTPVRSLKQKRAELALHPDYTSSSSVHYVGPWDFATLYNTQPLLNAGITGAGGSIAVVGRSDILMSDVQTYRSMFGLPENDPIFIHAGQDNGVEPGDDGESDLDVEISGGIAQQAKLYFVIGTPTFLVDGITNSIEYIVENNTADIMSISYGSCESVEGAGGNEFNNQAFEQAAAQGISIFVAAGDNGPAECDDQNDSYENLGYSTGGESSTPYNVSVGGTGFAESLTTAIPATITTTSTTGPEYWLTSNTGFPDWASTAKFYVPETPWNVSKSPDYSADPSADESGLWSGSGGISAYYLQPSWQRGTGVYSTDPIPTQGGYWVTGITLTNGGGAGYLTAPTVTFSANGSGTCLAYPLATSTINGSGNVTGIVFNYGQQGGTLKAGQGFGCNTTTPPLVTFGAAPGGGTTATASVQIGPMNNIPPLVSGVPHRYTPDLSLNADDGNDPTIFCSEGVCEYTISGGTETLADAGLVGGTSVAAPSMAGIQALINQANGGRQGNPNYMYYTLSAAQTESGCNSAAEVYNAQSVGSTCAFHDITLGDNLICGESSCTKGTYPSALSATKMGWLAGTGYDLATGLGSVNAYNLSTQWSTVVFNSSDTSLNLSDTGSSTPIAQGTSITISGSVAPGSGSGTPTGDVAFILSNGVIGQTIDINDDSNEDGFNGPGAFATLDGSGNYSASVPNLPAGTYTITARYAGDANFASSMSAPTTVTVAASAAPVITITPQSIDQSACNLTNSSTYTYGSLVWIPVNIASSNGNGVPTGTVTITVDGTTWGTVPLDPNGNGYLVAGVVPTTSCLYGYTFSQGPLLTGGSHQIGASYSGDATFPAATATPVGVTVNQLTVTPTLAAGQTYIASGSADQLTATFTASALNGITSSVAGPTGTVTFTDTTTSSVLGTGNVADLVSFSGNTYTYSATAVLNSNGITQAGANAITATYSGDANFAGATSSAVTVTVGSGTATTTAVTSNGNPTTLNGRPTFTATVSASPAGPTSGTVTFYDGTTVLGTGSVGSGHTATFRLANGQAFFAGAHNITASFAGVASTFTASSSAILVENVSQGTDTVSLAAKEVGASGDAFTLAAVVAPSSTNGTFAPNQGVVTFYDGATSIGTATPITVTSGQGGYGLWTATMSTSSLSAGSHAITATYSDINYPLATSNTQNIFVGSTATVTWGTPAAIGYGTALSATQLNATANLGGTFVYTPPLTTVLGAGPHTLSVKFTPYGQYAGIAAVTQTVQIQVNQAPLTITENPASGGYGSALPTLSGSVSSLVNGDTLGGTVVVTYVTTASPASPYSDAGAYPITAQVTGSSAANYSVTDTGSTLTISPASLSITVNSPTPITYGSALPTFTSSLVGLTNGDTSTDLKGVVHRALTHRGPRGNGGSLDDLTVNYTTAANSTSPYSGVGSYPINATLGGAAAGNYTVTSVTPGTLTINAAQLQVTATSYSLAQYAPIPNPLGYSITGLVNGDGQGVVGGSPQLTTTAVQGSATGDYGVIAAIGSLSASNYTFALHNGNIEITAAVQAALTSPVPSSTLTGSSATFSWSAGSGATGYQLWVGSTGLNSNNLYSSGQVLNTSFLSATVNNLPTTGGTIYVRLFTDFNGTWQSTYYTLTAVTLTPAALTSPAPGSTLASTSVTFTWTAGSGASAYQLWLGSTGVNTNNLYSSGVVSGTSVTANNLPANGSLIYARLYVEINSVWSHYDYTYTAATGPAITSPAPTSTLAGPSVTFTWSGGTVGATAYQLWLGSTGVNTNNLYSSGVVTGTSVTPNNLPSNGATIYARLYYEVNSVWGHVDYLYTAATGPAITSPTPATTLAGPSVTFTWSAGTVGATAYQLWLGSTGANTNNLYSSGVVTGTSVTANNLPTNGETVYARLYFEVNSVWSHVDYIYTAATGPSITSPAPTSTLLASSVTFSWSPGSLSPTAYQLWLGSTGVNSHDLYASGATSATSVTVNHLPTDGSTIYARLYYEIGGVWSHVDYTYTAYTH